jgi:hypothetical protein
MKKFKHIKLFEEISGDKVLSAERKQDTNLAAGQQALGVDGEVNQYGFDCVYLSYKGIHQAKFEAKSAGDVKSIGRRSLIVDLKGDTITSHEYKEADVVKVLNGPNNIKALFMKNMLCFVIPDQQGGDSQLFRGWIKTNDRAKVVNFLKKWDLFNKVNVNDIMLIADKLKNLQNLKQKTGEVKGSKKVTIDDVNNILKSESENKAEEIMKLFGK